jgi:hypothetical protein
MPCRKAGLSREKCGDRTLPRGKRPEPDGLSQVVSQWMLPESPTQLKVIEHFPGMGTQFGTTNSSIEIPSDAELQLVEPQISSFIQYLFTPFLRS